MEVAEGKTYLLGERGRGYAEANKGQFHLGSREEKLQGREKTGGSLKVELQPLMWQVSDFEYRFSKRSEEILQHPPRNGGEGISEGAYGMQFLEEAGVRITTEETSNLPLHDLERGICGSQCRQMDEQRGISPKRWK